MLKKKAYNLKRIKIKFEYLRRSFMFHVGENSNKKGHKKQVLGVHI